jgi:hypothetical protein
MKPRQPITKEARDHLHKKLERMSGRERKKTIKRLEMYDRGYRKDKNKYDVEKG